MNSCSDYRLAIMLVANLFWATAIGAPAQDVSTMPVRGSLNAPVSIMMFSDFSCPYCAKATATLTEIERLYPGKVIIVFKHFPLRGDEATLLPHEAAMAAGSQGKFWQMYDLLFTRQGKHQRLALDGNAQELHLNLTLFRKDMNQHRFRDAVMKDVAEARALRVTATPTFYIDGYKLEGLQSLPTLQQIIDNRLRTKSAEIGEAIPLQQFLQSAPGAKGDGLMGTRETPGKVPISTIEPRQ
ncbi:MAG: thioredoxin domain-containing protein [Methylotenera sp.]